jgi:hypothetical protein
MYKLLFSFLAITSSVAMAQEGPSEAIVGVHLASRHVPQQEGQNNANTGLYVRYNNFQIGGYRNTLKRDTIYAGYTLKAGQFDLMLALASGYNRKCSQEVTPISQGNIHKNYQGVTEKGGTMYLISEECSGYGKYKLAPIVTISYALPEVAGTIPRVSFVPGTGLSSSVVHLSVEWKVK